jgi:putative transposase
MEADSADETLHPGHHSIRLRGYDYSSEGLYFLTICTHEKQCTLGRVTESRVELSVMGLAVRECWVAIPAHLHERDYMRS